ncbi:hypothetical protein K7432_014189 [Basidiobolus ranarum]|uniref:AMP-dependent synthetase/ligase domain-containing protein n=1 Tax=Basidiobolus ranarum TaxID=34480 RepID=A0ABR2VPZ7_9FUNG
MALFDRSAIERRVGYLLIMLQAMGTDVEQSISGVNLLSSSEQELILQTWNTAHEPYPSHICIHHLFEQQVSRSPDAVDIMYASQTLTYAEVSARANRLAHLSDIGVKPNTLVALCIERSPAVVI